MAGLSCGYRHATMEIARPRLTMFDQENSTAFATALLSWRSLFIPAIRRQGCPRIRREIKMFLLDAVSSSNIKNGLPHWVIYGPTLLDFV
ncbi:MAG: hypothetical protein IPK25_09365 [Saprospiraceae bacterium]|nr:hypothetical protein [Saprospiraceae bacterium]